MDELNPLYDNLQLQHHLTLVDLICIYAVGYYLCIAYYLIIDAAVVVAAAVAAVAVVEVTVVALNYNYYYFVLKVCH
jgi:hypothetical protein